MKPSLADLTQHHVAHVAEICAREAGTTVEAMFSDSRRRRDSTARAAFFTKLHGTSGWTVRRLAEFTGRNEWAVHSAIFHSPRERAAT
jgi:hypothetical protein